MAFNLADFVEHTVDAVPDRTALICGDRAATFAELEDRGQPARPPPRGAGRRARATTSRSTRYNSIEFVETMLAAYKLRAVPINVNFRYVEDELVYLLDNSDAVAARATRPSSRRSSTHVRDRLPLLRHV